MVQFNQPQKSAVVEHLINTANSINFGSTSKLGMAMRYMDCLVKEAIQILLHPNNFNIDEGFNLSHTWHPVIKMLQWSRGMPIGKKGQTEVGT
jgi:hypothetical protein